jgi:hypothetical protein
MTSPVLRTEEGGEGVCTGSWQRWWGKEEKGRGAQRTAAQPFYTNARRWGTGDGVAPCDRRGPRERERESAEGVSRPIGSGPRPAGAGRGAPCRVAGPNRGRGEADWWGPSTVEGGRARRGPVGSGWGAREKEIERQGGGGVPTCGSERHSAGWRGSNLI